MVSRYYRDRLQAVVGNADEQSIASTSVGWQTYSTWVDELSKGIRQNAKNLASEIEGQAGDAMVTKFTIIADKLDAESEDMKKGSTALGLAHTAALEAIKTNNGIRLSGPMNQPPTKPEGPLPGQQATPEQTTAMSNYNSGMTTYLQNEQMYEDNARQAIEAMDKEYATQTQVMKEIHGEPDPMDDVPDVPPSTPGNPGAPTAPTTPGTPGTPGNPGQRDPDIRDPEIRDPEIRDPEIRDPEIRDPEIRDPEIRDPEIRDPQPPVTTNPHPPTTQTPHVPTYHPGHNVVGGTDGGFDYSPGGTGYTPSGPSGAGGGGMNGAGMAAGGIAGGAAGAAGLRGATPGTPLRSAGVKGIGATTRPSGPGSLSRGSAAPRSAGSASRGSSVGGSRGAAGAKGAAGGARSGAGSRSGAKAGGLKGSTSRGAAGRSGSAAAKGSAKGSAKGAAKGAAKAAGKGRGLFRRGNNGSATGGRGNKKNDERSEQRDALVYEQDWLGDESAGTGVLD